MSRCIHCNSYIAPGDLLCDCVENAKEQRERLITYASKLPEPTGARCKRCHKVIREDGHKGWCSSDCAQAERQEVSQARLRELVFDRDRGVCADCKTDCEALLRELEALARASVQGDKFDAEWRKKLEARRHQLVRIGFPRGPVERGESLWACDHIVERAAGGASRPEACQSLCLACHAKKTGAFAKKRANARKPKGRRFGR